LKRHFFKGKTLNPFRSQKKIREAQWQASNSLVEAEKRMASSLSVVLPSKTTLNRDAVQCLKLGMVHKDNVMSALFSLPCFSLTHLLAFAKTAPVNSIDFDVTGEYLV
jgi:hypothetical protein